LRRHFVTVAWQFRTLTTIRSSPSPELLLLMQGINQFAINPREIDVFLGPLSQSELIDKICHSPYPL
jgi:hypothetical protein